MALPSIATAAAAVDSLYAILADRKTRQKNREAVASLQELKEAVVNAYQPDITVVLTDATDAGVSEAIAAGGEIGLAKGSAAVVGEIFVTNGGTADVTDNALGTAKGGAVASGDRFQISGADAVVYLGTATEVSFSDEEIADFVSIGS
jgi:hypothetical protein